MDSAVSIPEDLLRALSAAKHLVVLTGSGVSAESGIPTFREAQTGLWSRYDPHQLATPRAFAENPRLVWEWYEWRRELIAQAEPNPAHVALADLQYQLPKMTLITQNVDGMHQTAGSWDVIELHGNIRRTICSRERTIVEGWPDAQDVPPRCQDCQAPLRPDVVWFGEPLPARAIDAALRAAGACDLFFSVGTSAVVHPAASLAHIALQHGAQVVEINAERTPLTAHADYHLLGRAGVLLPALLDYFR